MSKIMFSYYSHKSIDSRLCRIIKDIVSFNDRGNSSGTHSFVQTSTEPYRKEGHSTGRKYTSRIMAKRFYYLCAVPS